MITLRLDKNGGINKGDVVFYESDNISEKYVIQLYKNNKIYDLTGKTIELTIVEKKRKYGNIFNLPIENATEGKFRLLVTSDISKECGLYDFKVTVKDDIGLVETFPSFQVEVLHDLTRSIASEIVNRDDFEILTEGLKALSDYNIYKTNAMKVPSIEENIKVINSSLETIEKKVNDHIESCSNGEKLIVRYVHQGNKEIYFSNIDYDTGIATTTEPHGITTKTEIMIVPNDWTLENYKNNVMSVPIEYTTNNDIITVTRVSDTELKITKKDGTTLIPVNKSDISNTNIDCTKFHFEVPIPFTLYNLEASNYLRFVYMGYVKACGQYRYTTFKFVGEDGNIYYSGTLYVNHLGVPAITNALSTHCVFAHLNQIWDFRECSCAVYNNSAVFGRRSGYSNIVWDKGNETDTLFIQSNRKIKGITQLGTYNPEYPYLSNNSILDIYDLGGA